MKFMTATVSAIALTVSTGAAVADTVTILAADLPPMVDADGSSREAEIVTRVMEHCGHEVN